MDPLWPLSLSIPGWTDYDPNGVPASCKGAGAHRPDPSPSIAHIWEIAAAQPAYPAAVVHTSERRARRNPLTVIATDLLLEATGVSKTYGAVVALQGASLTVRAGEVHALMGANGAGKSTFVKILTGAVIPDSGRIMIQGRERTAHSPADARRNGLVSVYQEPAVIPDLDIRDNLRLTATPVEPFRHWVHELGVGDLNLSSMARRLPLATRRIVDLARALAIEPDVLLLDEITAALPADLTERVLQVVRQQGKSARSSSSRIG